ncbi:YCF48-related protein [Variovorax sp. J22R115]|uniref:WD40/YVTN/BNR-like repeat-containing protein n=1 Tax=Variovorax sp. J22R115 TaxID=3053509 RepID=UPI0025764017|nr:YCF48-related protein [Variovorax sp. J22R115]MDM0051539.1 YCF48-related protein [Variovorax sp. J22R115]
MTFDPSRRSLIGALTLACGGAAVAALAATAAPGKEWRDVLDTPAVRSPLGARSLINGLARAGHRIVAVGQRGHVLLSDDGGASWRQAEVPVSSDLVAVCFPTERQGWAVGHDGVILRSTDAGQSWTLQLDGRRMGGLMVDYYEQRVGAAQGLEALRAAALLDEAKRFAAQGAENPLLDVWFKDAQTGYAVGAFGLALRTNDGGARWEPLMHALDNPKSLHLYAVRSVADDVFVVGEQGLALQLESATDRFVIRETPYKGTLFGIVAGTRALIAFGLRGSVVRSTDGGRSWSQVTTGVQTGLTAGLRRSDGRIVLVSQAGHVLVSQDDGASFQSLRVDQPMPAAAVAEAAGGALVIAGPRGAARPLPLS